MRGQRVRRWGAVLAAAVLGVGLIGPVATAGAVPAAVAALPAAAAAAAPVPAPAAPTGGPTSAVVVVETGGDRIAVSGVQVLAGVRLGLFRAANDAQPVDPTWGVCTSDAVGECYFVVPSVQFGGVNHRRSFVVKEISAPAGWTSNTALRTGSATGSDSQLTPYRFRTPELRPNRQYRSGVDFMTGGGGLDRTASSGVWQQSRENPDIGDCGLRVALVLDLSASVGSSLPALKSAAGTLVDSLVGTPSQVALFTFATNAPANRGNSQNRPLTPVSTTTGAAVVDGWINGVTVQGGGAGGTNWDRGLAQVAAAQNDYDLTIVITDGNPSFYDEPSRGPGTFSRFVEVENGIFSANAIKAEGTRVVALGVGSGISGPAANLAAISGPVANSDYYQSTDYAAAAATLRTLALQGCAGRISVINEVIPFGGDIDDAVPAAGWQYTATSPSAAITPPSGTTDTSGGLTFDLAYGGGTTSAEVTVAVTQQAGYAPFQPGGDPAVCTNLSDGSPVPVTGAGVGAFDVTVGSDQPISCTAYQIADPGAATVEVDTAWVVNGVLYDDGAQPVQLSSELLIDDVPAPYGVELGGFVQGQSITIDQTVSGVPELPPGCTYLGATITPGTVLPSTAVLVTGANTWSVINAVECTARLTLLNRLVGGDGDPDAWTLTGTGPDGSLPGPSGTSGVTAFLTSEVDYALTESAGDPRYVQALEPGTGAPLWDCNPIDTGSNGGGFGSDEPSAGSVVAAFGEYLDCEAVNVTADLSLTAVVDNSAGGTATPADVTITATPTGTVPSGLEPVVADGSGSGFVRPEQTYELTVDLPAGYRLAATDCRIEGESTQDGLQIVLAPDTAMDCTLAVENIAPRITLAATVQGGSASAADWTLQATGPVTVAGRQGSAAIVDQPVVVGDYSLTASGGPAGYQAGAWTCGGTVQLQLADDITCSITFVAVAPTTTASPTTATPTTVSPTQSSTASPTVTTGTTTSGTALPTSTTAPTTDPTTIPTSTTSTTHHALPDTGADVQPPLTLGMLLLALGGGLVLLGRRRPGRHH
ncbi:LPXTG cell wall anchor domain-containing protein [Nakamurella sp. YIM 132087]|uniref:LPXTG cell wall anchor domain-containing protein n=1 Tax=Nakamurella alba TaxID=2665158 RepID=A0A7K1FQ14_9ACTN|nr:LPXTG cell wall anchor domain-containing protein [Nakamurella alba]MTD16236.1 LPXTG cell wall anchor domain-containing protein [Nakamurella alba]